MAKTKPDQWHKEKLLVNPTMDQENPEHAPKVAFCSGTPYGQVGPSRHSPAQSGQAPCGLEGQSYSVNEQTVSL